jgi:hypothetical protein
MRSAGCGLIRGRRPDKGAALTHPLTPACRQAGPLFQKERGKQFTSPVVWFSLSSSEEREAEGELVKFPLKIVDIYMDGQTAAAGREIEFPRRKKMALRISAERLAKTNLFYIAPQRMKELFKTETVIEKNLFLTALRTPRELISEQLTHNRVIEQFSALTNPSRIEVTAIDLFSKLLKTGMDESVFDIKNPHSNIPLSEQFKILRGANLSEKEVHDLRLINSRNEYAELVNNARNGEQKLIETDLKSIFARSLDEIERHGSANLKIVARYFEFLKKTLEKNFIEKEVWAHFTGNGLATYEKLEELGSEKIADIFPITIKTSVPNLIAMVGGCSGTLGLLGLMLAVISNHGPLGLEMPLYELPAIFGSIAFFGSAMGILAAQGSTAPPSKKQIKILIKNARELENVAIIERENERIGKTKLDGSQPGLNFSTGTNTHKDGNVEILSRLPGKETA